MRGLMRNLGKGNKKALSRMGLGEMADMVSEAMPQQPKRSLVDLKMKKDKRKMAKKAKRRNR